MPSRIDRPTTPATTPVPAAPATTPPVLREGARGPAVVELQQALNRAGFSCGEADGKFGARTATALRAFQQANGLEVDGVAGRGVWEKLGRTGASDGSPANPGWAPRSNDGVLFVAVNNSEAHRSTLESDALRARGVNVTVVQDSARPDIISTTDRQGVRTTHDLSTEAGATGFALTLGLPAEQTRKIADVIRSAGPDAKDEIAQLAQAWAVAERGGQVPSRLVLSGHHVGYGVYGENNGRLEWPLVGALAEAMPRGARSVEDLLVAGCYSAGQQLVEQYQAMFPNVKTILAYTGSSPGAASGATAHQRAWEQATRGTRDDIDRRLFQHMRKGENVAVWTRTHGLQDGRPPATVDQLRGERASNEDAFRQAWSGAATIQDSQRGPVRDFYNATQRLIQHPDTPAADRRQFEAQRDQTIRLLFYGPVSRRFGETYGTRVAAGYASLGLAAPDFKTMTRGQALESIRAFQEKLATARPPPAEATRLAPVLADFAELKPSVIPDTWI